MREEKSGCQTGVDGSQIGPLQSFEVTSEPAEKTPVIALTFLLIL